MAKAQTLPSTPVSFRVPVEWIPYIRKYLLTTEICQRALLRELGYRIPKKELAALEVALEKLEENRKRNQPPPPLEKKNRAGRRMVPARPE